MQLARLLHVTVLFVAAATFTPPVGAAITPEQRAKVQEITAGMREAGELFSGEKYVEAAEKITLLQEAIVELMNEGGSDKSLQRLVLPLYRRLANAHGKLEIEGAELPPRPSWEELMKGMPAAPEDTATISFSKDLAPWFISTCGNCHINNQRGQFSMASYSDLMKGPPEGRVLFAGAETGNRLVEVIESGDMPRGGGRVTPEQLTALKTWIVEGAKFDGEAPAAPLSSLVEGAQPDTPKPMTTAAPTGNETVSFSKDIAPLLLQNCNGCHINGQQASGGLRMNNFEQLLAGGDSGAILVKNAPVDSLLVQKLRGMAGARMPAGGRPALAEETIQLIETWIREGATFDGPSATTNIDVVVNRAWAADASHEELYERRKAMASASWGRALPQAKQETIQNNEMFVIGNVPPTRLESIAKGLDNAFAKVKEQFKAPEDQPLIRGGLAVFVLKSRYDYSEFGRMIETRELPREWFGHWRANPVEVYAVLNGGEELTEELLESVALQVTAGAYIASYDGVPFWFAEGVARNLVLTHHRRDDPRVKIWQASLPAAGQRVENASMLLEGRLDEEAAGTVGMSLTNFMMDRSNRRRFDNLMKLLREGRAFDEALTATYAPPAALVRTWLGK